MTTFTVVVELYISGAWLDITRLDSNTRVLDEVTITRGRGDEASRFSPTEVRFQYMDNNALLDGDNPASTYYRLIGLGTPMRVKVDGDIRAVVEIVDWTPTWSRNANGTDIVTVSVVGAGLLRRIEEGKKPLKSAAYRALTAPVNDTERIGYWPLEEESNATTIFSPYSTGSASYVGTINFGAETSLSSARLATFGSSDALMFFLTGDWTNSLLQSIVMVNMRFPETPLTDGALLLRMYYTGGTVSFVDLKWNTGDLLSLLAYGGGLLLDTLAGSNWSGIITDSEVVMQVTAEQSGADVNFRIRGNTDVWWRVEQSDTLVANTLGRLYAVTIGQSNVQGLSVGQLIVGNNKDSFGNYIDDLDSDASFLVTGGRGYLNEHAVSRIDRISDEENLDITITGTATSADSDRMGAQGLLTSIETVYASADLDMGLLFEQRDALELEYRTRVDLYNQVPTASLSYSHLLPGFQPAGGDLRVTNKVTAQSDGGGTASYTIPDDDPWHWTTQDPPDGAGERETEATIPVASDSQLTAQAAWRAHVASWREKRFRTIPLELARDAFTSGDRTDARALDLGKVLSIDTTDAPGYVPYNEVRLVVQGYTETISKHLHNIVLNTTPADVYEVEVNDMIGSTLAVAIDDNDTSIVIESGTGPTWSNTDEPYHIQVGGQPMTVTTMTTGTAAFVAAGAIANGNNAGVTPALPAGITPDVGQLLLIWATIRNSGTGVPDDESGWRTLATFGNTKLYGRYYVTGDVAPQITFTGGVANADTQARMFAFSSLSMAFASGTKLVPAVHTQLNGSAQNIDYPALTVNRTGSTALIFAWKQDDWTGVAPPSGYTEMADNATTTGDDSGIAAYYNLSGATAAAGTLTVTGGASAISRAVVLALRPLKLATVTRGIAGVAASAAVGAAVHSWRPGVNGL